MFKATADVVRTTSQYSRVPLGAFPVQKAPLPIQTSMTTNVSRNNRRANASPRRPTVSK
jgi:hypothetical protein